MTIILTVFLTESIFSSTPLQCSNDKGACYKTDLLKVIDGDTISINDKQFINLSLVSAPELSEKDGNDSKVFLEAICPVGSKIIIDEDDGHLQKSHDMMIAQVFCNGMSMNAEMIYNNYAIIDDEFCGSSEFTFESWATSCGMNHVRFLN